jgi:hypothetical protein
MAAAWLYATVLMSASAMPATQLPTPHTVNANCSPALPDSAVVWSMTSRSICGTRSGSVRARAAHAAAAEAASGAGR